MGVKESLYRMPIVDALDVTVINRRRELCIFYQNQRLHFGRI